MDKELLRIAIIGTGLIIIVGMVISAYLKDKEAREEDDELDLYDEYDDDDFEDDDSEEEPVIAEPPLKKTSVAQTLKNVYAQKIQQRTQPTPPVSEERIAPEFDEHAKVDDEPPKRPAVAPAIIQFSVITKGNEDFNGADIFDALEELGLQYGSNQIFERIDENRFVQFGVACITAPGTFPEDDKELELFYCPGVAFFMQVDGLENPVAVFDDYVHTAVLFAQRLNGVVLDHRRQVLTQEMVEAIHKSLEQFAS